MVSSFVRAQRLAIFVDCFHGSSETIVRKLREINRNMRRTNKITRRESGFCPFSHVLFGFAWFRCLSLCMWKNLLACGLVYLQTLLIIVCEQKLNEEYVFFKKKILFSITFEKVGIWGFGTLAVFNLQKLLI